MLEYQNLFTRVQVRAPAEEGLPLKPATEGSRLGRGSFGLAGYLAGKLGDAQIGPIYLGTYGVLSSSSASSPSRSSASTCGRR
jgi:photosynthetic reaction center M subunit